MGPYWWPDSTKPGGLPYVRRDGERNPEIRRDYDAPRLGALTGAVGTLALAYNFRRRAVRAARHAAPACMVPRSRHQIGRAHV